VYVCSLSYPVCSAHTPCCYPRRAWLYIIFPYYLIQGMLLKKIIHYTVWAFILFTTVIWNFFHSRENWARCDKNVCWSCHGYSCLILMKPKYFRRIFEKFSNMKFHKNSVQWEPRCSVRTEVNNRFAQFYERVWKITSSSFLRPSGQRCVGK